MMITTMMRTISLCLNFIQRKQSLVAAQDHQTMKKVQQILKVWNCEQRNYLNQLFNLKRNVKGLRRKIRRPERINVTKLSVNLKSAVYVWTE